MSDYLMKTSEKYSNDIWKVINYIFSNNFSDLAAQKKNISDN